MRNPQLFAPLALLVFQACGTDVPVPVATDLGNAGDVASDVAVDSSTDAPADTGPDVAPDAVSRAGCFRCSADQRASSRPPAG